MDFGYKAEEILWLVESGLLTLGYQSSSYLTDRVPELSFVDLPFLFRDNDHARGAMDGALGKRLVQAIESKCELPHPRLVRERLPPHLQPRPHRPHAGRPQGHAHPRAAEPDPEAHLRAARRDAADHGPHRRDPHDQGRRDRRPGEPAHQHRHLRRAQVPPLPHHQQSFLHFAADLPAPADLRRLARRPARRRCSRRSTESVAFQRELHVKEEEDAEAAIKAEGCEIVTLDAAQHDAFAAAVQPIYAEARKLLGDELFKIWRGSPDRAAERRIDRCLCRATAGSLQSPANQRAAQTAPVPQGGHACAGSAAFCSRSPASRSAAAPAAAQGAYPNRPIRVLIPYAPGGLTDVVARYYAEHLRKSLGQNVHGREQARRLRHHRHRGNGPRQARRLHHHGRQHLDQLPDAGAARQAHAHRLRPRRADHRAARRRAGVLHGDHDELPAQDLRRVHRLRQGASGRRALRLRRHRRLSARQHRDPGQARRRARARPHSVQGRRLGHPQGRRRRRHPRVVVQRHQPGRHDQGRQGAAARGRGRRSGCRRGPTCRRSTSSASPASAPRNGRRPSRPPACRARSSTSCTRRLPRRRRRRSCRRSSRRAA